MTAKEWIESNLDADGFPAWVLANLAKFSLELLLAGLTIVPFFGMVYGAIRLQDVGTPFGAAGPLGLYLLLLAGAYREFWNCRLGD